MFKKLLNYSKRQSKKKILISLVLSFYLFFLSLSSGLFVPSARAQEPGPWYNQNFQEWYAKVYNQDASPASDIFGERYTAAQVQWVIYGLIAFTLHLLTDEDLNQCMIEEHPTLAAALAACADKIRKAAAGLIGTSDVDTNLAAKSNVWLAVFTLRPVSAIEYFKDIGEKLNIVPEAKAQGFGFTAVNPVLELWRFVRNTAYFLLIIVIIAMAFMIMFRVKISPQAVITIQSALPKIVIALVLITFSYAIAGFLIDLMYVVLALIAGIFANSPISGLSTTQMFEAFTERSIFEFFGSYLLLFGLAFVFAMIGSTSPFLLLIPGAPAQLMGMAILITIILLIILLIAALRILWLMLKTYVSILLLIIIGPFLILVGAVSVGREARGGFGSWLRSIAAQLAVYPAVAFMLVMAFVFLRAAFPSELPGVIDSVITLLFTFDISNIVGAGDPWQAPFTIGEGAKELLWLGVSLVTILLIPNVANIIKGVIESRPYPYGTAIGQAVGPLALPFLGAEYMLGRQAERRGKGGGPARSAGLEAAQTIAGGIRSRIGRLGR